MKLSTYFRSTAAYRVRIALNLKGVEHQLEAVNLFAAEHKQASFKEHNPQGLIPTLALDDQVLRQSMAILEYLEERYPQPALLPSDALERAHIRSIAQNIACDIHPLNNLRVLKYLVDDLKFSEEQKLDWYHHWLKQGFSGIETELASNESISKCCFGDQPTLADVCLIPQVYNAHRFEFSMAAYPRIMAVNDYCLSLEGFDSARPEKQADFV